MSPRSSLLIGGLAVLLAAGCSSASGESDEGSEDALSSKNLTSGDFGLGEKELVLTLDDGPGPRTGELIEFFVKHQIPAVFFQVGKNAKASPDTVKAIAEASARVPGGLIIANHSMTHTTPLPQQGTAGSKAEILEADVHLKDGIAKSQAHLGNAKSFFRPPYGAFTALGTARIDELNRTEAGKYVGPIFWNIGGELNAQHSADWACWGRNGVDIKRCTDGYIAEATARGRGIMLVHDVHSKTIDMLTGKGEANGRSLLLELQRLNFKFVGLRAHDDSVRAFADTQRELQASTDVSVVSSVEIDDAGHVKVSVETQGAARVRVSFDDDDALDQEFSQARFVTTKALNPGQHFVTVMALDASDRVLKAEKATVIVPAPVERGSYDGAGTSCINFDLMKAGQTYPLFHGKVACNSQGAVRAPGLDNECYRFRANLVTTRDPKLVGPGEWSVDFDVSYPSDPNDKSKMTFVVDAATGNVESGRRYAWSIGGRARADVPMRLVSAADCALRLWRGQMTYSNGTTEDVLFRAPPEDDKLQWR